MGPFLCKLYASPMSEWDVSSKAAWAIGSASHIGPRISSRVRKDWEEEKGNPIKDRCRKNLVLCYTYRELPIARSRGKRGQDYIGTKENSVRLIIVGDWARFQRERERERERERCRKLSTRKCLTQHIYLFGMKM